jgi:hexosaminidase
MLALSLALCAPSKAGPSLALMPLPAQVSIGEGKLIIDDSFSIRISGYSDRHLQDATARLASRIARQTGIPPRRAGKPTLVVECRGAAPEYPALSEDESYRLEISPISARVSAPTVTGALRGMETFSQLIAADADSFFVPTLRIDDRPRFTWRGLMLDAARHWMPVPVIERNLDAMAAVKLNVFHWHLSDDQGFRVESRLFPKLQQLGSDGNFYTQSDVRRVIAYARDRGIRVVPEFDMPGHTTSWLVGYPELASAPGRYEIERKWGIFEPVLDPTREEVYKFLDAFLGEMAGLFPDAYFHLGGDEVLDTQWKQSRTIQAFAAKKGFQTSAELHAYFNRRIQALLAKHGKKMIGWDEVLAPGLAADVLIQSWRGQKSLADAARQGHRGILSYGYYLDHMQPASFHYQIDPVSGETAALSAQETALVLGGEACMWSEYVTEETLPSRIWPRLAAIAERFWSPRETTDIHSMYTRLDAVNRWLQWTGVQNRSGYSLLSERVAPGDRAPALWVLVNAVEALGIDQRQEARHYTSLIPLNRLADAASPESESVRHLEEVVAGLSADPGQRQQRVEELRRAFTEWSRSSEQLRSLLSVRFLLLEASSVSEDLSRIGNIGLRALQYLESGEKISGDWLAQQEHDLDRMAQPRAEVVLAAVRPVHALLDALSRPPSHAEPVGNSPISH